MENNIIGIDRLIKIAQEELVEIEAKRERILKQIEALKSLKREEARIDQTESSFTPSTYKPAITNSSSEEDKISLFRSLFRGREDVFPKRFLAFFGEGRFLEIWNVVRYCKLGIQCSIH